MKPLLAATVLVLSVAASTAHAQAAPPPDVPALQAKADAGDAEAQFELAGAYDTGRGVRHDAAQAMHWYRAAADQGQPDAQNSVGSLLQQDKRYAEALTWYEKAAGQNHAQATNNAANLYDLGRGVPQDRKKAFALYQHAADLGSAEAMWNMAQMIGGGQLGAPPDLRSACVWTLRAYRLADLSERRLTDYAGRLIPMLESKLSAEDMSACRSEARDWTPPEASRRSDRPH
jgi:TPR repeat protein